ncbi:MAG: hypothetical protein ACRDHM_06185 [Actinomycetota bacterium]
MKVPARLATLLVAFTLLLPGTASAHEAFEGTVTPGTPFTWDGTRATAFNISGFNNGNVATCGEDIDDFCEYAHITANLPFPAGSTAKTYTKSLTFMIDTFDPPVTDFDMALYTSDATGAKLDRLDFSGNNPGEAEDLSTSVRSTRTYNADGTVATENITSYYLIEVVYFAAVNATYKGTATF